MDRLISLAFTPGVHPRRKRRANEEFSPPHPCHPPCPFDKIQVMKRWTPLLTVLLVVATCLIIAGAASACPMCKDSTNGVGGYSGPFSNAGGSGNVTRGF